MDDEPTEVIDIDLTQDDDEEEALSNNIAPAIDDNRANASAASLTGLLSPPARNDAIVGLPTISPPAPRNDMVLGRPAISPIAAPNDAAVLGRPTISPPSRSDVVLGCPNNVHGHQTQNIVTPDPSNIIQEKNKRISYLIGYYTRMFEEEMHKEINKAKALGKTVAPAQKSLLTTLMKTQQSIKACPLLVDQMSKKKLDVELLTLWLLSQL